MPWPHAAQPCDRQARARGWLSNWPRDRWGLRMGLLVLLVMLLGACTPKLYETRLIPATGPEAETCLQHCELPKTQCQQRQETRERSCEERYTAARADYDVCIANKSPNCRAPVGCLGVDLSICDRQYTDCFADCGGRIEKRLRPQLGSGSGTGATPRPAAGTQSPKVDTAGGAAG